MKEIKDYLHLYLGTECKVSGTKEKIVLTGVSFDDTQKIHWAYFENTELGYAPVSKVKLVLRNLSDMTEEEFTIYSGKLYSPDEFIFLLKQGYDLFGLIEAGLALDAKTLTK